MGNLLPKLGLGSRLDLATIAELGAWAPPRTDASSNENDRDDSWRSADGLRVEPQEVARIWREIAAGQWSPLASADIGAVSYVSMRRTSSKTVEWAALNVQQRSVLDLVARGVAQKVIAMKLGLAPSTVSARLHAVRRRLGFASFAQLVRAYCAARDVIEHMGQDVAIHAS